MDKSLSKSQELFQKAKKIFPGGVNSPVRAFEPNPFFVTHSKGCKIYSVEEKTYIDYCLGYGVLLLGHANAEVLKAVEDQLHKGTLYGAPTELENRFAELIQKCFPSIEMLRLVNSGAEATMHAIRAARGFTGKNKVIKFEGCFHGAHDCVLVKAGSGAVTNGSPDSLGIPQETTKNTIVLPFNNTEALEETIKREGQDIAAVIVEPVMGNVGLILPKKDYLTYLRKLTKKHGIVLIFDEIITGFRVALGGAQEYFKIKPDMTTLGKILGGGFPIAAFGGKKEIMQQISPVGKVYQAGTFSGNPVSVTAGLKTLEILNQNQNQIYPKLQKNCDELTKAITDLALNYHVDLQIHKFASMFQVFFSEQPIIDYESAKRSDTQKFKIAFQQLLKQGVFIPPSQFETCFLSNAHEKEDVENTIKAFEESLKAVSAQKEA